MPIIDIVGTESSNCKISRCVEAIWINDESEVYYFFDIVVDNTQESERTVESLLLYLLSDCTDSVRVKVETLFPDTLNREFPSDLSNTFFEQKILSENRFLTERDEEKRTVDRKPPLGPDIKIPRSLTITSSLIGNHVRPARGTLINITIDPPLLPGQKANLRLVFKRGRQSISNLIKSYRKHWTGVLVSRLIIRSFDYETLTGSNIWIEHKLPVEDYRLLVVLPPDSEDAFFSVQPDASIFHEFQMLSDKNGPSRLSFEWRFRPEQDRPFRIRGKYIESNATNWEFIVLVLAALAGFLSLAFDFYQLYKIFK